MSDTRRRPWFQIHLSTALVLMIMTGYGMLLWNWRNPWHSTGESWRSTGDFYYLSDSIWRINPMANRSVSPDRTRTLSRHENGEIWVIEHREKPVHTISPTYNANGQLSMPAVDPIKEPELPPLAVLKGKEVMNYEQGFIDDDTLALWDGMEPDPAGSTADPEHPLRKRYVLFKRRFPERWWGQFYRPEVWLGVAVFGLYFWFAWRRSRTQEAS